MTNEQRAVNNLFHDYDANVPVSVFSPKNPAFANLEYKKAWIRQIKYSLGTKILDNPEHYLVNITTIDGKKVSPGCIHLSKLFNFIDSKFEEPTSIRLQLLGCYLKTWVIILDKDLKYIK